MQPLRHGIAWHRIALPAANLTSGSEQNDVDRLRDAAGSGSRPLLFVLPGRERCAEIVYLGPSATGEGLSPPRLVDRRKKDSMGTTNTGR